MRTSICLILLLTSSSALAGFERRELELPGMTMAVTTGDLNGDGLTDIIASYRRGAGPATTRFLAIFLRGKTGYPSKPSVAFAPPKNAAIFDLGDAFGDAKQELVYLTPTGVFAQALVGDRMGKPTRIVGTPTLVGSPEEEDFPWWDFLRDVPGLGRIMLVPNNRQLLIYKKSDGEAAWKRHSAISVRQHSYYDAESPTYRRSSRGGSPGRPYALRVTTIIPNLDFVEQTGDGRTDLVTNFDDRITVHPQLEDGTISSKPSHRQWLRVLTKQELKKRDTGVSAQVMDLDGDNIADLVLSKIGGGITTLKSEVRIHRGKKGGGFSQQPDQVFRDDGFGSLARFEDVDGDGVLEMVHPHSEVSIVSISSAMLSSKLSLDIRIRRRGDKGRFFEPSPVQTLETSFGLDLSVGAALRGAAPIFGHDFDGDGIRDVILSEGGEKMLMYRGRRGRGSVFEEDGNVSLSAAGSNTTLVVPASTTDPKKPDVLVYYVARKGLSGKLVVFANRF